MLRGKVYLLIEEVRRPWDAFAGGCGDRERSTDFIHRTVCRNLPLYVTASKLLGACSQSVLPCGTDLSNIVNVPAPPFVALLEVLIFLVLVHLMMLFCFVNNEAAGPGLRLKNIAAQHETLSICNCIQVLSHYVRSAHWSSIGR